MEREIAARDYLCKLHLSFVNDFLTTAGFASYHGLLEEEAADLLRLARAVANHPHPEM